jgi:hypothetical protein
MLERNIVTDPEPSLDPSSERLRPRRAAFVRSGHHGRRCVPVGTVEKKFGKRAIQAARSLVLAAQISTYDEIVTSSVSSAGSMMPMSIDPHALHLKL